MKKEQKNRTEIDFWNNTNEEKVNAYPEKRA